MKRRAEAIDDRAGAFVPVDRVAMPIGSAVPPLLRADRRDAVEPGADAVDRRAAPGDTVPCARQMARQMRRRR
jgi:hypothetical protein